MRHILLAFALPLALLPLAARAAENGTVIIKVNFVVKTERLSPEPMTVHPHTSFVIVLHPNGTVAEVNKVSGKFGKTVEKSAKLGTRFRVVDDHTLAREWYVGVQKRTLTIQTSGNICVANLKMAMPEGKSEFETPAADFGTMGRFRDAEVESIDCAIE
jgi:hypothetical protein